MKVLMVITVELGKNGIATCVLNYCETLNRLGVQTDIAASGSVEAEIKDRIDKCGTRLYHLPSRSGNPVSYWCTMKRIIRDNHYDILHVHGNSSTMAFELSAAIAAGCKVRIPHSHNTTCGHLRMHRLLLPFFNRMYTHAAACGHDAGKWLFGNRPFHVIPNGIQMDKYRYDPEKRQSYRAEKGVRNDEILIGHIGLFNYQKNHEFLLRVFVSLCKRSQRYRLILAGDGPLKSEIIRMAESMGLGDKIIFAGNESNIPACLSAMDLFVLPSRFEGLPYVLIEAQASALPCVVADTVTEEADVTGLVHFVHGFDVRDWTEAVINNSGGHVPEEEHILKDMKYNNYDISHNGEILERYYANCLRSSEKKGSSGTHRGGNK